MLLDNDFNVIISSIRKENDSVFRKFDVIGNGTADFTLRKNAATLLAIHAILDLNILTPKYQRV